MQTSENEQQSSERSLEGDLARLKLQLELFQGMLSKHESESGIGEFDAAAEQIIGEIFRKSIRNDGSLFICPTRRGRRID